MLGSTVIPVSIDMTKPDIQVIKIEGGDVFCSWIIFLGVEIRGDILERADCIFSQVHHNFHHHGQFDIVIEVYA